MCSDVGMVRSNYIVVLASPLVLGKAMFFASCTSLSRPGTFFYCVPEVWSGQCLGVGPWRRRVGNRSLCRCEVCGAIRVCTGQPHSTFLTTRWNHRWIVVFFCSQWVPCNKRKLAPPPLIELSQCALALWGKKHSQPKEALVCHQSVVCIYTIFGSKTIYSLTRVQTCIWM